MDEQTNTGTPAVETYPDALARINKANESTGRMMSHSQRLELASIAQRQWGGDDAAQTPDARPGHTATPGGNTVQDDRPGAERAGEVAEREAFLAPYGLREHAGRSTAEEAVAVASVFQAEGIEPERAASFLQHFKHEQPATDARIDAAFGTLSAEDSDLVSDYLDGLSAAHPTLNVLSSLRRCGLLGNAGFLAQVAEHVRTKRR